MLVIDSGNLSKVEDDGLISPLKLEKESAMRYYDNVYCKNSEIPIYFI